MLEVMNCRSYIGVPDYRIAKIALRVIPQFAPLSNILIGSPSLG